MVISRTLQYCKIIITCFLSSTLVFFLPSISLAQDEEVCVFVSSFDEFTSSLNQMMSTGGTIVLDSDITVPASESFTYVNGRYRKEVFIETRGHTIYIEGSLVLWPFLTISGNDGQKELFHVYPGGELRLVSICIDAGESGTAIVQEEGSFLMYGSEEDMGLPEFSCTGAIQSATTMTAAAYWRYNCEELPIVRVPDGQDFTADMLPDKVLSVVNRDHEEYEEEAPVIWDDTTFPEKSERTLVQGSFADGYSQYGDYMPVCLVVWESDTCPFFLNVYLEAATQWYDTVFMYGEAPQSGTVYVQSSDTGEDWEDIDGTDGYAPVEVEQNGSFSWLLSYDKTELNGERPKYYRLRQVLDDGTELHSEILGLSDQFIFTGADIEGGRGGETSPNEGESQLPAFIAGVGGADGMTASKSPSASSDSGTDAASEDSSDSKDSSDMTDDSVSDEAASSTQSEESKETVQDSDPDSSKEVTSAKTDTEQLNDTSGIERIVGTGIVVCILLGAVGLLIFKRKNTV